MAGVESIIEEILQEARAQADEIILKANVEAEQEKSAAVKEGEELAGKMAEKARRDAAEYEARILSQIDLRKRQSALSVKQDIVKELIDKAYEKLKKQDKDSYFAMIEKLLASVVRNKEGEIAFGRDDLDRLPEDFVVRMQEVAKASGGSIKVAEEPADIDSGFLLSYGGIQENCSLRALFDSSLSDLQDEVQKTLWNS